MHCQDGQADPEAKRLMMDLRGTGALAPKHVSRRRRDRRTRSPFFRACMTARATSDSGQPKGACAALERGEARGVVHGRNHR